MNQDLSPTVSEVSEVSEVSTIYKPSPVTSVCHVTPTLSLQPGTPLNISHSYRFSQNILQNVLNRIDQIEMTREHIIPTIHKLMEQIEKFDDKNILSNGKDKKNMVIDLLYFLSEKNAMPLREISDTIHIILPAIDVIVLASKGKTEINKNIRDKDEIDIDILNKINNIKDEEDDEYNKKEEKQETCSCLFLLYLWFNEGK